MQLVFLLTDKPAIAYAIYVMHMSYLCMQFCRLHLSSADSIVSYQYHHCININHKQHTEGVSMQ